MSEGNPACVKLRELLINGPRINALNALSDHAVARGDRKITIEYGDIPILREDGAVCPESAKYQDVGSTYILELQLSGRTFIYCSSIPFKVPFPKLRLAL